MKIIGLFLNNEIRTGGHTRYLELLSGIGEKGHSVTLYKNSFLERNVEHVSPINVPFRYTWDKRRFLGMRIKKLVLREMRSRPVEADWIVIFGETHWPAAKALSRRYGIPVLYALRSDSITEARSYLTLESPSIIRRARLHATILFNRVREADITRHAALIAFQSSHDRDAFVSRNRRAEGKTAVIRGDIRQARFKAEYSNTNRSTVCRKLLFVGTLGTRKGLAYLLKAMAALPDAVKKLVSLDILAAGTDYEPFDAIIREAGLSGCVRFHGKVSNPLDFMKEADLLVTPALFDSYPNVVLEALHVGLPVIGSRVGGIPDMLSNEELIFEPASITSLADRLEKIVQSNEHYAMIRRLCAERRSYFDFDWAELWITAMKQKMNKE